MLVAALDTATLTLSCALLEVRPEGAAAAVEVLAERSEHALHRPGVTSGHGARLPAALTDLLVACGRRLPDVEGYAVGLGPGSFTGLRIGLATLKGLAYASRRPLVGVSSLAALALAAAPAAEAGALLVPLLDARKGEVYAGFYRRTGPDELAQVHADAALGPEALLELLRGLQGGLAPQGFGEGYAAHAAAFQGRLTGLATGVVGPDGAAVGRLAAAALRTATFDQARLSALEPHYVRASEAEVRFPQGLVPPTP